MSGKMELVFFPPGHIRLNKELLTGLHKDLAATLAVIPPANELDRIVAIATYCGVVVDGAYNLEDRDRLCDQLATKLVTLRRKPDDVILLLH